MKHIKLFLGKLIDYMLDDRVSVYAAQVSFFVIISAIPLVMLLIPLIQFLIPLSQDTVTKAILAVLPSSEETQRFVTSLLNDVYTNSASTIISVSAITTLWAASKGIYSLQQGLNSIAYTKETRNIVIQRLLSIVYTLGFIFVLIFTLGVLLFGNKLQLLLESWIPSLAYFSSVIILFRTGLSITLFMLFFVLIYTILPNKKLSFWKQIPGAAFTTFGWLIFSYVYSLYIDHVANFSYIYGSLTAIILLMLWLYICMNIVLLGAELNKMLEDRSSRRQLDSSSQPPHSTTAKPDR
ncbi:YihY/virulence factor BrkB family protein [Qiania dongpingensis]|uniref:YihY/virulence factor BrkB family protein n=1 Tax=Qiania dongpingensis TaxID=2763669 RepID=A0A7G9G5L5_9FIRM|nr:YihY/virulence factor BrkB family protein [Qiania dongpingensis]QNM06097.1 YihY/virulence factor BrkB family protein [Qiania dongpingensis]